MAGVNNKEKKSGLTQTALTALVTALVTLPVGAIIGTVGQYWVTTEEKRLQVLQDTRQQSYVEFLKLQLEGKLDLQKDPTTFVDETGPIRRKISIYGPRSVVEALARHWRDIYEAPPCCGELPKLKHSVGISQSMRLDVMPRGESISDADMMFMHHFCKMPESEAETTKCAEGPKTSL